MLQRTFWVIILLLPIQASAQHNEKSDQICRFNLQYAGNIGLLSAGAGTGLFKNYVIADLHYGYLPKRSSKNQVHTIALKTSIKIYRRESKERLYQLYIGTTCAYSHTDNTYLKYPGYFPYSYYDFPNSIHLHPYFGIIVNSKHKPIGCYAELGSSDYKIISAFRNSYIGVKEIVNLSFGISYYLNSQ
ncbi:MAG: hypothetical protein N2662_03785 [Bacteroidales bacterium]|nr:hypothetical protein [Bacteroidales bacterium]